MLLEVQAEYIEIMQDIQKVIHNVYDIIAFGLLCLVIYLLYRLFNSFF